MLGSRTPCSTDTAPLQIISDLRLNADENKVTTTTASLVGVHFKTGIRWTSPTSHSEIMYLKIMTTEVEFHMGAALNHCYCLPQCHQHGAPSHLS